MTQNVQVKLTAGAALDFAEVLGEAMEHIDPQIIQKAQNAAKGGGKADPVEVGMQIVKALLRHSRESATRFLATCAGMTPEELRAAPLSTMTEIIRQIKEDPELEAFIEQVRGMLV